MPLRSNEASKSTASKVRCTMARASGGLMCWMGRDNGNEHSFRKPRLPGPSAGWNPAPSKRSLGRSARGAVRGRHPFAARARSSAGMPDRAAHGYAGRRAKEGARGSEEGSAGERGILGTSYARCTFFNQMSTLICADLARRMQGVHFLTKCQPLLSLVNTLRA